MSDIFVLPQPAPFAVPASYGAPGAPGTPGANVMAIGLFTAIAALSIPGGTTLVHTSGHTAAGTGHAIYVEDTSLDDAGVAAHPRARAKSANGRYFRISHEYGVNIDQFGAVQSPLPGAGTQIDMSAAWLAAKAYMNAVHVNGGNNYHGVPIIDWPAGHYHMGTTTVEPSDTGVVQGAGSGKDGIGGYGATMVSFALGATAGFRIPFPNTSGNTATGVGDHDAPGGMIPRGFRIKGPYVPGTGMAESEAHGFVQRGIAFPDDLYVTDWPGDGYVALAGTIASRSSAVYGGNTSCSTLTRIRCEGNRWGFVIGGTDGNIINSKSCEAYLNRQGGLFDDNGAGCNKYETIHCAGNGLPNDGHPPTRVHYLGNIFAVRYGRDTQCSTNAPPATQVDDANWYYIRTGFPDTTQPTWVSGTAYRAGGDYVTTDSAGVTIDTGYVEGDGFSQFGAATMIFGGGFGNASYRGGRHFRNENDGFALRSTAYGVSNTVHIDAAAGYAALDWRIYNPATTANDKLGGVTFTGGYTQFEFNNGGLFLASMAVGGASTNRARIDTAGVWALSPLGYDPSMGGTQTQLTSKSTAVTLNKVCGQITMNGAALASATAVSFTLNNSMIAATDEIGVNIQSGATAGAYIAHIDQVTSGSCRISLRNLSGGSLSEAVVITFNIRKG